MSKVTQFVTRYPSVDGYTLIAVLEHINRKVQGTGGIDTLLSVALVDRQSADYLVRTCLRFQKEGLT